MKSLPRVLTPFFMPSLRSVSMAVAALFLCLLTLVQPARASEYFYDNTTVNYTINDSVFVYGSPTVNFVSGGYINGSIIISDSSTVNVYAGSSAYSLTTHNTSTVNVYGGSLGYNLDVADASTVNLFGGSFAGRGTIVVNGPSATINMYGTGLSFGGPYYPYYGPPYYLVYGTLADGTYITSLIYLYNGAQISQVVLHNDPFLALTAQVKSLADAGTLGAGNTNALLVKLTAAQTAAASGDVAGERDALTAFLNQVKAFVRTGKLTAAQGTALTGAAQGILNSLG
jgi:hypothetical protein